MLAGNFSQQHNNFRKFLSTVVHQKFAFARIDLERNMPHYSAFGSRAV